MRNSYVITSGWWCGEKSERNEKRVEYGSPTIREKQFFSTWYDSINRNSSPEKILIVDSASPTLPDLPPDARLELLRLNENGGHATSHVGHLSGFTRAVVAGLAYALACEVDYWVYVEQDAILKGEGIIEYALGNLSRGIAFGNGIGTPQPIQQSVMIVRKDHIARFINALTGIRARDAEISPEVKFAMAATPLTRFLPEFIFRAPSRIEWAGRLHARLIRVFFRTLRGYDYLPYGYGRSRPIDFSQPFYYFQHGSDEELEAALSSCSPAGS
ncbi:hypothetical protein [Chitinasiproducens palmae]|uniref:Uncharacterized protein n=1 Tax=Chitinasiproducens palmae TaxID=1770053 RepID=A0A1H2PPF6_9BURK|nr:hypothetical protein [Chitinasiproducens palmae]SDV48608.1 hypothetical protein SAMN05216551_105227 [Chitinasiproducens palmae]